MNSGTDRDPVVNDLEMRLRGLTPRQPLIGEDEIMSAVVDRSGLAPSSLRTSAIHSGGRGSRRQWMAAMGLSASIGAVAGAACMLLIVNWNSVASEPLSSVNAKLGSDSPVVVSETASNALGRQPGASPLVDVNDSTRSVDAGKFRSTFESLSPGEAALAASWIDYELNSLTPGALGAGTRLVSRSPHRPQSASSPSELAVARSADFVAGDSDNVRSHADVLIADPPLPQRAWMQLMLKSPNQLF